MSTYTTKFKTVIENHGREWLNDYPIFDEGYRQGLNDKIIDHYLNQEIGQESVDMFIHAFRRKMNEIMPQYNDLYRSKLLEIDPFITFRTTSQSTGTGENTTNTTTTSSGSNTTESTGAGKSVASEFPQTRLSGDENYATSASESESAGSTSGSASESAEQISEGSSATEGSIFSEGFSGSMSALMLEYRQTILDVDLLIIDDLRELFMLIWDNYSSMIDYPLP